MSGSFLTIKLKDINVLIIIIININIFLCSFIFFKFITYSKQDYTLFHKFVQQIYKNPLILYDNL